MRRIYSISCNWAKAVLCRFMGLEVSFCYTFKTIQDGDGRKARKMIEVLLPVEIIPTIKSDTNHEITIFEELIQASGEALPDDQQGVTIADREMLESNEPPCKKKLSATEIER